MTGNRANRSVGGTLLCAHGSVLGYQLLITIRRALLAPGSGSAKKGMLQQQQAASVVHHITLQEAKATIQQEGNLSDTCTCMKSRQASRTRRSGFHRATKLLMGYKSVS